jgi:Fe2+ transport system protein FeoA
MTYLSKMTPGQQGKVIGFADDSRLSRRLLELGLVPGRTVTYLRNAPLQDPMEVKIGPCCLSLRRSEASLVAVELEK